MRPQVSHANNARDLLTSQIPEDGVGEATIAPLQNLMDFGALKAVKREETRGKKARSFEWADKRKKGVVNSRCSRGCLGQEPECGAARYILI